MTSPQSKSSREGIGDNASNGIGILNESSLHAAIKSWYAQPGDRFEVPVDRYVIDIVRGDLLIEIQTNGFTSIRAKLRSLLSQNYRVVLLHPVPVTKWLVYRHPDSGDVVRRRKSPKRGQPHYLFDELVRMPTLISHSNMELQLLMTEENELRCADGKGSWRRKGVSILDRELVRVVRTLAFREAADFAALLPEALERPFSNKMLASSLGDSVRRCRRMTYCLRKMDVLRQVGRVGNELLFDREGDHA